MIFRFQPLVLRGVVKVQWCKLITNSHPLLAEHLEDDVPIRYSVEVGVEVVVEWDSLEKRFQPRLVGLLHQRAANPEDALNVSWRTTL